MIPYGGFVKKVVIGVVVLVLAFGLVVLAAAAAGVAYYAATSMPDEQSVITIEEVLERPDQVQEEAPVIEDQEGTEEAEEAVTVDPAPTAAPSPAPRPRARPRPAPAPKPEPEPEPEPEPSLDDLPEDDAESLDRVLEDFVIEDLDSEPETKRRRRN